MSHVPGHTHGLSTRERAAQAPVPVSTNAPAADDGTLLQREQRIDEQLEQTFPASDPPGWTMGVARPPPSPQRK